MPSWITDMISRSYNNDITNMPELEIDPNISSTKICATNLRSYQSSEDFNSLHFPAHNNIDNNQNFVFHETYGVIQKDVLERWDESNLVKSPQNSTRKIPPVRNSLSNLKKLS